MALADVLKAAKKHYVNGIVADDDTYVFQCPDGILIISNDGETLKAEAIAGAQMIILGERLEIETEPKKPGPCGEPQ